MARRKRGRKIKHTKSLYRRKKSLARRVLSVVIIIVIMAGLGFLGYSIAPPIIKFFKGLGKENKDSSSQVWTPPEVTSSLTDSSEADNSKPDININAKSYTIPKESLLSEQSLKDAISVAKNNGYTEIVAPLKIQGGEIYFNTQNAIAVNGKAVKGTLTAADIVRIIKESGLTPVAQMSILYDNLAPRADYHIGYQFENEETMWLDNSPQNGGKPWMSPFSEQAKVYISQLIGEVGNAGFTKLITTDYVFPRFLDSDLNYIGAIVKDPNRNNALTSFAQFVKTEAEKYNMQTVLVVSAVEVMSGTSSVLIPDNLKGITISSQIDIAALPVNITLKDGTVVDLSTLGVYDKVKTITTKVAELSGTTKIIPVLNAIGLSENDVNEAIRAITDLGYSNYVIIK
jgi:hypothetical protein